MKEGGRRIYAALKHEGYRSILEGLLSLKQREIFAGQGIGAMRKLPP